MVDRIRLAMVQRKSGLRTLLRLHTANALLSFACEGVLGFSCRSQITVIPIRIFKNREGDRAKRIPYVTHRNPCYFIEINCMHATLISGAESLYATPQFLTNPRADPMMDGFFIKSKVTIGIKNLSR